MVAFDRPLKKQVCPKYMILDINLRIVVFFNVIFNVYIYSLKESEDGQLLKTKKLKNSRKNKNVSVLDLHQLHEKLNLSNLP